MNVTPRAREVPSAAVEAYKLSFETGPLLMMVGYFVMIPFALVQLDRIKFREAVVTTALGTVMTLYAIAPFWIAWWLLQVVV